MTYQTIPQLITPRQEDVIYPYHPVWRSLTQHVIIMTIVLIAIFAFDFIIGIQIPYDYRLPVNVLLSLSPLALWFVLLGLPERAVPEPREQLPITFLISALVAQAVAVPVLQALYPSTWLAVESILTRILGYASTLGLVQVSCAFLILRFVVSPLSYRIRVDGIAYAAVVALAYATVINIHDMSIATYTPLFAMLRIYIASITGLFTAMLVAYSIVEVRIFNGTIFLQPFMVSFSCLIYGIAYAFTTSLSNNAIGISSSPSRIWLTLLFSLAFTVGGLLLMAFVYQVTERRSQERILSERG